MVNIAKTFRPAYSVSHKSSRIVRICCLLLVGLVCQAGLTNTATAATYYLDAVNGDDGNPGTSNEPWQTIPKIGNVRGGNTFSEGDTCYIRNGSYSGFLEESNTDRTSWTRWIADTGHTPTIEYIVVKSVYPDGAHDKYYWFEGLTVAGGYTNDLLIRYVANYGMFKNMTMTGDGYSEADASVGIHIYGSSNVTIEDCIVNSFSDVPEGGSERGIWIQACQDVKVINCDISRSRFGMNLSGGQRIIITNNVIHDLDSDGLFLADLSDSDITDNEIYNIDIPVHWILNGSYTYTDANQTITRVSGDALNPVGASGGRIRITSAGSGVVPVLDETKPAIFYKSYWPNGVPIDEDALVLRTALGSDYNDITKIEVAIAYHVDGIQIDDGDHSQMLTYNIRIDRNKIYNVMGQGFFVNFDVPANCGPIYFRNNLLYNIATDVSVEDVTALYFINNDVPGDHQDTWQIDTRGAVIFQRDTTVVEFYNNVIDQLGGITDNDIMAHDNNIYYQEGLQNIQYTPGGSEIDLSTLADLKALFVDYDGKDFRLASGSVAIDFANSTYAPAIDLLGNPRDASPDAGCYEYISGPPDTTPPSVPQSLTAQPISQTQIDLTWQASTDPESGISYYKIYRAGSQIDTSVSTSYSNIGLNSGTTYSYEVSAVNGQGLESGLSNTAQATTLAINLPPDISAIPNTLTKQESQTITTAEVELATDPEGDPLTYTYSGWLTSLPYTTTYDDAGTHTLHVDVSDGTNTTGKDITITVNNVNRPPILGSISDPSVDENALLSISVNATDPDGQALTYSVSGLPAGAVFASQTLTWTPSYDQAGTFGVTFTADDGQAQDSEAITITVINVNRTPVLAAINSQSVWADDPLTFTIDATDPDGDPVTYSAGTLPSGATFIGRDFDWTPSQGQGGSYDVTFIASDGPSQDSQMVTITVDVDSLAPIISNSLPTAGSIQAPLNNLINLNITDAGKGIDADSVTIKVNNNTVYTGDTNHYSSPEGECRRLGNKTDYRFVYQSNEDFDYDQTLGITVTATDLAGNVMSEHSYSFVTEMRSFGQNKQANSGPVNLNSDRPVTVRDSSGNIWAAWHAGPIDNRDIYIGKLAAGADNFGSTVQLTTDATDQCNPAVALDSSDKLYVVWQDNREGDWDIYVSTSVDGTIWSTETRVNDPNNGEQVNPAIVIDGQSPNQAHVVWQDDRAGNQDICIATSSNNFVTTTVSQITSDTSDQVEPAVTVDSADTIYVVWTDGRNGPNDIYGAASNTGPWTNLAIVSNANNQSSPTIAAEAAGSILHLLWADDTSGDNDIHYATSNGLLDCPLIGFSIIDDTSGADQLEPTIVVEGSTGNDLKVFACWQDWRNADTDLYFAELSAGSGTNVFVGDGGSSAYQGEPVIGIDEYDHPYLVWADSRNTDIYYARSTYVEPVPLISELAPFSSGAVYGLPVGQLRNPGDICMQIPGGAYSHEIRLKTSRIKNAQRFGAKQSKVPYEFGPSGIEFNVPITITIAYEPVGSPVSVYWHNPLTGTLSQTGITNVTIIEKSQDLHLVRFKVRHFTSFYLLGGGAAAALGGGGGGGCSVSASGEGNIVEFFLPYIGFVVVLAILTVRDARIRKARNMTSGK